MRLEILQEIQEYSQWLFDDWEEAAVSAALTFTPQSEAFY